MPQQSVSKLWVALAVLDSVDRGKLTLDQTVTLTPADLVVFNQPMREGILAKGSIRLTVAQLLDRALRLSDNTANDKLLRLAGGPSAVRRVLAARHVSGIRFGPGETMLQSRTAGLEWKPEYALGRNFETARAQVPMSRRREALELYLADPEDGAEPRAIAATLVRLGSGELLSPTSTAFMLSILARTHSGPLRIKAAVPKGWSLWHKTGTGQVLGATATGYNDVAILRSPEGRTYGLAILIAQTDQPIPARMRFMQQIVQLLVEADARDWNRARSRETDLGVPESRTGPELAPAARKTRPQPEVED